MTSRRQFIAQTGAMAALAQHAHAAPGLDVANAPSKIVSSDPTGNIKLTREWKSDLCSSKLTNNGEKPARIQEVVLFSIAHSLPADTRLYGESFQMLSQTVGTLGKPVDLGYSEPKHYKIPQPEGVTSIFGLLTLAPPDNNNLVLAFTSCKRFAGRFYVRENLIDIVVDTEGLELHPGQTWNLEEFQFTRGENRSALLTGLADRINHNHPPRKFPKPPTGWCSWYCFGPRVTAQNVEENLDFIARNIPALKYVQIDDGYQPAMGDWLETGKAFGGDVIGVLKQIRQRGFEPAIWVAPFIAERDSHLFQQHPDWFIQDAGGQPLSADKVTFQGWRHGPWFALDGTHPEVQKHFVGLFHTMRHEWGCTYFKLDANFWGAMHGGRFHDPKATRIEAYRRGMEAILRGSGDSFILGCNHPIWASFGLIDGSRSSGDIKRTWPVFEKCARQNLSRNWQDGRLWWNDPDAVTFSGDLPDNEFLFHAASVYASGGMVLSGDDLTKLPADRLARLRKLLPPTGVPAEFEDDSLRAGMVKLPGHSVACLFNWSEQAQTISFRLPKAVGVTDYWTSEDLGRHSGVFTLKDLSPHSARLLVCT
jgi:alpha-galactosidase